MTLILKITRRTHKMAAELHVKALRAAVALANIRVAGAEEAEDAAFAALGVTQQRAALAVNVARSEAADAVSRRLAAVDASISIEAAARKEAELIGKSL